MRDQPNKPVVLDYSEVDSQRRPPNLGVLAFTLGTLFGLFGLALIALGILVIIEARHRLNLDSLSPSAILLIVGSVILTFSVRWIRSAMDGTAGGG